MSLRPANGWSPSCLCYSGGITHRRGPSARPSVRRAPARSSRRTRVTAQHGARTAASDVPWKGRRSLPAATRGCDIGHRPADRTRRWDGARPGRDRSTPSGRCWPGTAGRSHERRRRTAVPSSGGSRAASGVFGGRSHPGRGGGAAGPLRAQRDRREEGQPVLEVPHLPVGADPVDDRDRGDPVGRGRALGGLLHHLGAARRQRRRRVLGGAPGRQRHRRLEGQPGDQGPGATRRELDHAGGTRARTG